MPEAAYKFKGQLRAFEWVQVKGVKFPALVIFRPLSDLCSLLAALDFLLILDLLLGA